ncbi:hypothetical protein POUND7_006813 [Theobroma cacao]
MEYLYLQKPHLQKEKKLSKTQGKCFLDLKELRIKSCGVQEVFQLKGLPLLTTTAEHQCYCSMSGNIIDIVESYKSVSLSGLTTLELSKCKRLKHIFTPTLARNLPRLKYLSIWECEDLEQIIANDDGKERDQTSTSTSSRGHFQPICFCALNKVKIGSCNKMKSLFPVSVAMPKPEILKVEGASELKQLFGDKDEEAGAQEEKQIVLPQLWMLDLLQLPSLITYCPRGYHLVIPYLIYSKVENCPKLCVNAKT